MWVFYDYTYSRTSQNVGQLYMGTTHLQSKWAFSD